MNTSFGFYNAHQRTKFLRRTGVIWDGFSRLLSPSAVSARLIIGSIPAANPLVHRPRKEEPFSSCWSPTKNIRNASPDSRLASTSTIHGNGTRKRQFVPSSSGPLVFVVDDEPVIASTLAVILQMHGFSAKFFISPLEALTAARATSPDLLISDVDMPGLSGIDLAIRMKALYPWCKILLFSGQPSTFDLLDSARAQGQEFDLLLKPVPPPGLIWEIRKRIDSTCDVPDGSRSRAERPLEIMASSGARPHASRPGNSR